MSIEDRRADAWNNQAERLGEARLRYVTGKPLRHYAVEERGKFHLITDVYCSFSSTDDLFQFVDKKLNLLKASGVIYSIVQSVRLDDGKDTPDTVDQTELLDSAGREVKVCSWLRKISCVDVACESTTEWTPTERILIRKVCSEIAVPRMKLLKFEAGNPPGRKFQLE